jgi:predicted nucleic acid-binding protein
LNCWAKKDLSIAIKQQHNIAVPDAIIAATAKYFGLLLVTADKGFKKLENSVEVVLLDVQNRQ